MGTLILCKGIGLYHRNCKVCKVDTGWDIGCGWCAVPLSRVGRVSYLC